ncbi:MAG TPA: hypothetical protein VG939_01820 [Caulobacteraceae bacterium]|nr:hypothetical protein [Caulobacteraceae bacterium]
MHKIITGGMAALTLGASVAGVATPADAQSWHHGGGSYHGGYHGGYGGHYYHHGGGNAAGAAIAGGIVGLALGSALSSGHHYYSRPYYGGAYYGPGYYYDDDYGYATCWGRRRVWDPYIGGYVVQRFSYAC